MPQNHDKIRNKKGGKYKMKDRIKKIRKELDLTQQEFADRLGTARNNIAGYETGKRQPSDAVISLICVKFNVNENWLREGTGEMFIKQTRDEQIASFIGRIQMDEGDSFKKRLISVLANLTEEQWELLADMAKQLVKEKD